MTTERRRDPPDRDAVLLFEASFVEWLAVTSRRIDPGAERLILR
jgi:hypothetical protein